MSPSLNGKEEAVAASIPLRNVERKWLLACACGTAALSRQFAAKQ